MKTKDEARRLAQALWKEHEPYVRKLCEYKLQSIPDRIEDCVQEVFLALTVALNGEKPINSPKAWLTRVACNKINDAYKEAKTKSERLVSLTDELAATIPDRKTIDFDEPQLGEDELLSAKDSFLKSLSPQERELFDERFVRGLKAKEIASAHKTTESNVRKRVFRLKNKAKEYAKAYVKNSQKH